MSQMKDYKYWFGKLNPALRKKALKNMKLYGIEDNQSKKHSTFSNALFHCFVWESSPEGHNFWCGIWQEAYDIEQGLKPDVK